MSDQVMTQSNQPDISLFLKIFLSLPAIFIIFICPFFIFVLPIVGYSLLSFSKTKIHGIFLLSTIAYFVLSLILLSIGFKQQIVVFPSMIDTFLYIMSYYNFAENLGFFTYPIIIWGTFLFPFAFLEMIYFLYRKNVSFLIIPFIAIILFLNFIIVDFKQECIKNFNAIREFTGQSVPQDELFAACGLPAYHREYRDTYIYTNADMCAYVNIDENGMAHIHEHIGAFLD